MRFVDEAVIEVTAGSGGDGALSFRREKFIERGGPDGGDGGDGGDVYLYACQALNTLVDFRFQPRYAASNGEAGSGRQRTGARGEDLRIRVPCGTIVSDNLTDEEIGDLVEDGSTLLVAAGGRRGLGNTRFKSSTNRAPRRTTKGTTGEQRTLRLELRLMADVGLLGAPNAGKSSLLNRVSDARPKVADYPFTTLEPCLGVARLGYAQSLVLADIPGLIEGSHQGAGLGLKFLRHLSRTSMLLHLVDIAPVDGSDPLQNIQSIESELLSYSSAFESVPIWVVFNKIDLLDERGRTQFMERVKTLLPSRQLYFVSAATGEGVEPLLYAASEALQRIAEQDEGSRGVISLDESSK